MMWRHRARVDIYGMGRARTMLNAMEIPVWARLVGWEINTGGTLTLEFDSTDPAHFYYCPDSIAPPMLAFTGLAYGSTIDWFSLDGMRHDAAGNGG